MEYEIYIVQPCFSKTTATNEILTLSGVTENYIKGVVRLSLISSEGLFVVSRT